MPEPKFLPELELQVRKAMDVPEPNAKTMDALREQFISRGVATLKPNSGLASASHPFRPEKETKMKRTSSRFSPRLAWGMAFIVVAILLTLVLTSPTVVNALRRLLGYIPGVGFVEQDSSLRILDKSITVERENVSLTIEQVVASPDKTIVVYHYFVPPFDESAYQTPMDPNTDNPALVLPDGNKLEVHFGRRMVGDGLPTDNGAPIRYSLEFPALPTEVMETTLEILYLPAIPPGVGPENWQIPLKLIPAPEGFTIPVYIVEGTGMDDGIATETVPSPEAPFGNADALHDITASLDLYIPQDDGYLLIGSMQWSENDYPAYAVKPLDYMKVTDANGGEILFKPVLGPVSEKPQDEEYRSYWAIKILVKSFAAPLKIKIDSASVNINTPFVFQFDPGPNPAPGQGWEINQDFQISDIQARILKATLTTMGSPDLIFQFDIQAQPNELADVFIGMSIGKCMGGGGGSPTEPYESIQVYDNICRTDLPLGPLDVQVSGAQIWGPWQVEWTPPATTTTPLSPTAPPPVHIEACLNKDSWQLALKSKPPLPADLTGKLVLAKPTGEIVMADLQNGTQKVVGKGDAPSLSPDGSRIVVLGPPINSQPPDGLYVIDLASGTSTHLPGTTPTDGNPIWSPDGTKIAFTRRPIGSMDADDPTAIMVVNPDGTDLRQLIPNDGVRIVTAWMPDSIQIVYIARYGLRNASANLLNIETGDVNEVIGIDYGYGSVDISPDGKQAVYENWLPGDIYALFTSSIDGMNQSLLAQGPETTVVIPKWSPDGRWIAAAIYEGNSDGMLALIQVDTCQIIPLQDLTGYVGSWIP